MMNSSDCSVAGDFSSGKKKDFKDSINEYGERVVRFDEMPDVDYIITERQELLDEYYIIRQKCYEEDLGFNTDVSFEDHYDKTAMKIVIVKGGKAIGGARLNIAESGKDILPSEAEHDGFFLKHYCSELGKDGARYSEISRVAFIADCNVRNGKYAKYMFRALAKIVLENNCSYLMGISDARSVRYYAIVYRSFGFDTKVIDNIVDKSSKYSYIPPWLIIVTIKPNKTLKR